MPGVGISRVLPWIVSTPDDQEQKRDHNRDVYARVWQFYAMERSANTPALDHAISTLFERRPVLYCEGEQGKLDQMLYGELFGGLQFVVIPLRGCKSVVDVYNAHRQIRQETNTVDQSLACVLLDADFASTVEKEVREGLNPGLYLLRNAHSVECVLYSVELMNLVLQDRLSKTVWLPSLQRYMRFALRNDMFMQKQMCSDCGTKLKHECKDQPGTVVTL